MKKSHLLITAAFGILLLISAGCSDLKTPAPLPETPTFEKTSENAPTPLPATNALVPSPRPLTTATTTTTPSVKEFSLTAKQWSFSPSTITVKRGDRVKLRITSVDVTHGFKLPDFNIEKNLEPGKTVEVEFTADQSGSFPFFCNVFCGAGHDNMNGTLIVQ